LLAINVFKLVQHVRASLTRTVPYDYDRSAPSNSRALTFLSTNRLIELYLYATSMLLVGSI